MKKLFAFILIAMVTVCTRVQAQPIPSYRLAPAITYTSTAAGISNTISQGTLTLIDCSKQRNVAISITSVASGAAANLVGFTFTPTVDGTTNTMMTNLSIAISSALNGTSTNFWGTNLDAFGYKGFIVTRYTNNDAVNITNVLTYASKIGAP